MCKKYPWQSGASFTSFTFSFILLMDSRFYYSILVFPLYYTSTLLNSVMPSSFPIFLPSFQLSFSYFFLPSFSYLTYLSL
ncbi:hypothetical protein BDZ91DRAFT_722972 [Kalaharituber pfeilii]|nr:hypothetical protein BDZ91DRAFT_722972 [Kalaharituber pfeilii]